MIEYSKTERGDILRLVGAGAPGYAQLGDLVRVTEVQPNGVKVEDKQGNPCEFVFNCGAARLEQTEWRQDFPPPPAATTVAQILVIAKVCHEANRAYCATLGDSSQPPWEDAPAWQRESAIKGVDHALANAGAKPSDSHQSWLREKEAAGWKYGPVKDPEKREHPCFVAYDQLPPEQRAKDALFLAVVRALAPRG